MLNINIITPSSMIEKLRVNFKSKRLVLNLTQDALSKRSGVSLGSLKRFESSGAISLESLLKIALVLECIDDFLNIANHKELSIRSIDDILNKKNKTIKQRGTIK
jgi:transcriptional regulator with XRE-family HTH domain